MAVDERAWWKDNPEPKVGQTPDRLVLWNYPVGRTELAEAHSAAVKSFLGVLILARPAIGSALSICGHASPTGEAASNVVLARDRAENVARYIAGLGFKGMEVSSSGSSQPDDPAPTGQAMARNRRVEVTKAIPTVVTPPRLPPDTRSTPDKKPAGKLGAALTFEYECELELGTSTTAMTETAFIAVLKIEGRVIRGDGAFAAGLSIKHGSVAAKFEAKLAEHLKARLELDPGAKKVNASVVTEGVFPVEVGFQPSTKFFFQKVTLGVLPLPELDVGTAVVSLEIHLQLLVETGPSKALIVRAGAETAKAAAITSAAVAGVFIVTGVIIGGIVYASDLSKKKMAGMVVDAAERDGAASEVAAQALGATDRVRADMREYRLQLTRVGGEPSRSGFDSGVNVVATHLELAGDASDAKVKAWKETYAKGVDERDFDVVRKRVFDKLGAFQTDPLPVAPMIEGL